MPPSSWSAVATGVLVALAVALAGAISGFGVLGPSGAIAGGYIAGRGASEGAIFHGAIVGAALIIIGEIVSSVFGPPTLANVTVDTLATIVRDGLLLGLGALGGWLASRGVRAS